MRFITSLALVAASVAPVVLAQDVTIDPVTLTQCADSTINWEGATGPFYVAILPASDPCSSDAIAEYYDVQGNSVDYTAAIQSGTPIQVYILDNNQNEYWGQIETVGDGDGSCLPGASSSSSDSATSTSTSISSSTPAAYTPSSASTTHSYSYNSGNTDSNDSNNSDNNNSDTPANAVDDTSGAASVSASVGLMLGAFAAVAALL